jgi:F-type H+-transporting ATPase subunit epsilon
MADTLHFDLVSPERRLAAFDAREVRLPGAEGQLTAMPDHAPVITTLRPGLVVVTGTDGATSTYAVTGGFAEITQDGAAVLAERAYAATADNRPEIEAHLEEARKKAAEAAPEHKDAAELMVEDLVQLMDDMV